MPLDNIVVSVSLNDGKETVAQAEVLIPLPADGILDPGNLIDALQRSVAHCLDELTIHLDRT